MKNKAIIALFFTVVLALAAGNAFADEKKGYGVGVTLGIRGVISFSQMFSALGVTPGADLELGYIIPALGGRLAISVSGGYLWAEASGSGEDPRLVDSEGGTYEDYSWHLDEHQAIISLRFKARIFPMEKKFTPYLYVGGSLYILWSVIEAESGDQDFGTNTERSTTGGINGGGGVEYAIGPGRIFGEICIAWSPLDHDVTGDKSTGNLGIGLGYVFVF